MLTKDKKTRPAENSLSWAGKTPFSQLTGTAACRGAGAVCDSHLFQIRLHIMDHHGQTQLRAEETSIALGSWRFEWSCLGVVSHRYLPCIPLGSQWLLQKHGHFWNACKKRSPANGWARLILVSFPASMTVAFGAVCALSASLWTVEWPFPPSEKVPIYVWTLRHEMLSGILESFLMGTKEKES